MGLLTLSIKYVVSSTRRLELMSAKPLRAGAVAMHYRRAR
jgi:hypothetical protein